MHTCVLKVSRIYHTICMLCYVLDRTDDDRLPAANAVHTHTHQFVCARDAEGAFNEWYTHSHMRWHSRRARVMFRASVHTQQYTNWKIEKKNKTKNTTTKKQVRIYTYVGSICWYTHLDRRLRAVCGVNPHAAHSKLLCIEYRLTNVRCMRSIWCWLTDDARWWLLYRHHRQNHHWRYYAHAIIDDRCGWQKGRAICERRMRFGHRFHTATHSVWPVSHCRW